MVNLSKIDPFEMVDIGSKESVPRHAEAQGRIVLKKETIKAIKENKVKKGDPLAIAEIACIQAAKRTPDLIPMCHQIPLSSIDASFELGVNYVEARCKVKAVYKTGLEMEALTGVSIALLTVWDMVKYLEKDENGQYLTARLTDIHVTEKRKG